MLKLPRPHKVSLESGTTLLYQRNPISPTIAFGIRFDRGSRDEDSCERGLSHLLEHMVFRGTIRRDALRIALDLERIGGQWDAFTGKEMTCYHGKVLEEHFEELADVLADITMNPAFPGEAFKLERRVVLEEIKSAKDSPEDSVHDLFFETLFKGHPLSHPVAGYYRDVVRHSRRNLVGFHRKTYISRNALLGFIGNLPLKKVISILEKKYRFGGRSSGERFLPPVTVNSRVRSLRRSDWSQSHVCIGAATVPASSKESHALVVLSSILGGGVSSRLFQSMRERAGLVYSVYTHASFWRDTGAICTYFSVDPRKLWLAMEIFNEDLNEIREGRIRDEELESAKAQIKGAVVFGCENVNARLFRLFNGEVYYKKYMSPSWTIREVERVDRKRIAEVARKYLEERRLTYVTCGPVSLRVALRGRSGRGSRLKNSRGSNESG